MYCHAIPRYNKLFPSHTWWLWRRTIYVVAPPLLLPPLSKTGCINTRKEPTNKSTWHREEKGRGTLDNLSVDYWLHHRGTLVVTLSSFLGPNKNTPTTPDNQQPFYISSIYTGLTETKSPENCAKARLISIGPVGWDSSTLRSMGWLRSNQTMRSRVLDRAKRACSRASISHKQVYPTSSISHEQYYHRP